VPARRRVGLRYPLVFAALLLPLICALLVTAVPALYRSR
jgi:hypothetical protein